ncbi:(4Fe-4S)-binding protein [Aquimarina rhabdastrellae]
MKKKNITKNYNKGDLKILWEPVKCTHAAECVKHLPEVFRPNERPWIAVKNASIEVLKKTIDKCPSGAISYTEIKEGE